MSTQFVNGSRFAVSTSLAAAVAITAISNANPAIADAATLPAEGDILLLTSGWPDLSGQVVRAANPAAGKFTLEGVDTTNTALFPAGEGAGVYEKVSSFVSFSQVLGVSMSGGEQNFHDFRFVEDRGNRQRRKPTYKSAITFNFRLAYDPNLPWYAALEAIDKAGREVILRETLPEGDVIYYSGYLSFQKIPSKELDVNQEVVATFSINSDPIRYDAA